MADKNTIKIEIEGMTCAACSASVERALKKQAGVLEATVNLATNQATIKTDGNISEEKLMLAVEKTGFGAKAVSEDQHNIENKLQITTLELVIALLFGGIELYIGMSHMLPFPLPLPQIIDMAKNPINFALIQLILTIPVLITGRRFFINGTKNLVRFHPNMDSLVAIGTASALLYSIYQTMLVLGGNKHAAHNLYYESAAVVLALVLLGKYLEERSKNSAKKAISSLVSLIPSDAIVLRDGIEQTIPAKDIVLGDIIIVKAGGRIAVDGVVVGGEASVDEAMLTGESLPVFKENASKVSGGTICKDGMLKIEATGIGSNTAIAQVIKLVTEAQERKAPAARLADKISGVFVPSVVIIAISAALLWAIVGKDTAFVLNIFVSVLVVACPCALGLATPIAVMAGSGRGANLGILYRGGDIMELSSKIDTIMFDKTGTITEGKLKVAKISPVGNYTGDEVLRHAADAEMGSEHPIAVAVLKEAEARNISPKSPESIRSVAGRGVVAIDNGVTIVAGTIPLLDIENINYEQSILPEVPKGCTSIYVAKDGVLIGMIALSDTIKPDAKSAIARLNAMGIETMMITGDNQGAAELIAKEAGITSVLSQVLPQDKSAQVEKLKAQGKSVAMVGDGINDAPALTAADIGIAVFGGTDVAAEASNIILMRDELSVVADAIDLSRKSMRIIRENLFWAFAYNIVGIPIAAGLLFALGGPQFSPAFAGAAMAMSSVSVVLNSLRLTKYNPK